MNLAAFFLVICIGFACSFNIEDMDREYYILVNKTDISPSQYPKRLGNESETNRPSFELEFTEVGTEENLNKNPSLVDRVDRLMHLSNREIVHMDNNNKISLIPFKSIRLTNDDGEINVGYYKGSYLRNSKLVQMYTGGDKCDICKSKNWMGTIHYIPDNGPIELSGPIENSTCNYKLIVKGEELGRKEEMKILEIKIKPAETKEEIEEKTEKTEETEEKKVEVDTSPADSITSTDETEKTCTENTCKPTVDKPVIYTDNSTTKEENIEQDKQMEQTEQTENNEKSKENEEKDIKREDL